MTEDQRRELTNQLARYYHSSLFVEDKEVESSIPVLEAQIRDVFPRDYKRIEAQALNLALGQKDKGPF